MPLVFSKRVPATPMKNGWLLPARTARMRLLALREPPPQSSLE